MRLALLVGACALCALLLAAGAVSSARPASCSLHSVGVSGSGVVSASGGCSVSGRPVAGRWSYRYLSYDASGYVCGSGVPTTGSGASFTVAPAGSYRVAGTITLSPVGGGPAGSASASFAHVLGGEGLECGTIGRLPGVSVLCPWNGVLYSSQSFSWMPSACGRANTSVDFSSPPKVIGNVVTMGHVVSRSGMCEQTSNAFTSNDGPVAAAPVYHWLGYREQGAQFRCADGTSFRVEPSVFLVDGSGDACSSIGGMLPSFEFPTTWSGELYVVFNLSLGPASSSAQPIEAETVKVVLAGPQDACA